MADFAFGATSVTRAAAGSRTGTGYFTIEFWLRALVTDSTTTGHNFGGSLGFGFGDTGLTTGNARIGMYLDRNRPTFQTSGITGNPYNNPVAYGGGSNRVMTVNTWYHIAFVCDGTTTAANNRLYVNGYLYNNTYNGSFTSGTTYGQPNQISIGGYWAGNTACEWADFRVYKGVALYGDPTDTTSSSYGIGTGSALASNYTLPTRNAPPPDSTYGSYMVLDLPCQGELIDRTGRHTFQPVTSTYTSTTFGTTYYFNTTATSYNGSGSLTVSSISNMSSGYAFTLSSAIGGLQANTVYYIGAASGTTVTVWQYRDAAGTVPSGSGTGSATMNFGYYLTLYDRTTFGANHI
jgi:Concanavalin A-like lectin/glucanases superfamily